MANYETTTKMKVDISDLKKSMQEARKQTAYANSEFKAVSSSMDDWSKSSDGLSAKIKQLKSNLDSQEKVLEEYEKTLENVKREYGENSKEAMEYATKLNNQKAVVNKIKKELDNYEDALVEVSNAEKIASKTGKDVAEVLNDVGNKADDAGDGFTIFKGAIASFVGNGLTALVGGLRDAATSILGLAESTREYRDQMSKLSSASSEAGYTTTYTANKYKELYGVLADDTATTTTLSNFMALEAGGKTLDSLLNSSIGIWSKYGDSIPLDGLAEAINHSSKLGSVQGNLSDALEWSGINVDDFNAQLEKCSTEQERQELIASTLDDLYGDLADTYKENNKSIIEANEAQADYNKVMGELGATVEPITTVLKKGFTGVLKEAIKLFGGGVDVEAFTGKMEEGFGVITEKVLPAVKEGLGWIADNKDAIIAGLAGIASGFIAFNVASMIMTATTAIKSFTAGLNLAQIAMKLFNLVVGANPILKLVTIILAVVTALATFIATNDEARAKFLKIWDKIVKGLGKAVKSIGKFFTDTIPKFFKSLLKWVEKNWKELLVFFINPFAGLFAYFYKNNKKFKEFVDNAINYLKELPVKAWKWLQETINKAEKWRKEMIEKAKKTAKDFIDTVINYFSQLAGKAWTHLSNAYNKVVTWGSNMVNKAKETASNFINSIINYISQLPNKIWTLLSNVYTKVTTWGSNMINKAKDIASSFINSVTNYISQLAGKVWSLLSNAYSNVVSWGSNMISKAVEVGSNFVSRVVDYVSQLPSKLWNYFSDVVSKVYNWASNLYNAGRNAASNLWNGVVEKVSQLPSKILSIGGDLVSGLWNGINDKVSWLKGKISGFVGDVTGWLKDKFGIHSPSKVMADEIGKWLPEGIAVGISNNAKSVANAMKDLTTDSVAGAREGLSSIRGNTGGVVNNFTQVINSPKQLSRLDIYRQSKNLLGYAGGIA